MKIYWLGHASFVIETLGKVIVTDPFDDRVGYEVYNRHVDYVTVSHSHWDHNATHVLKGNPVIIDNVGEFKFDDLTFKGFMSYHDDQEGNLRGNNIIFKISAENINIVHLGDLGHLLTDQDIKALGDVDILLIPVGGTFTINGRQAHQLVTRINPHIVIPMHYATSHLSFELAPVEDFTKYCETVVKKPYLEIDKTKVKKENNVVLLDYLSWLT